jgi:hypothetical protein
LAALHASIRPLPFASCDDAKTSSRAFRNCFGEKKNKSEFEEEDDENLNAVVILSLSLVSDVM